MPDVAFRLVWDLREPERFLNSIEPDIVAFMTVEAKKMERRAKRRAPKKTGELRSAIHTEDGDDDEGPYVDVVSPRDKFQEKGHRAPDGTRVAARKYLRRSIYPRRRRR